MKNPPYLELYVFRCSGKRNHIPNIFYAGNQHHHSFKPKPETAVGDRAEFS